MIAILHLLLVLGLRAVSAAPLIEEPDFDAVQALVDHGVDVSELPLGGLQERSLSSPCEVAVCLTV